METSYYPCHLNLGGLHAEIRCFSEETIPYFLRYMNPFASRKVDFTVSGDDIHWEGLSKERLKEEPFLEYTYIMLPIGDQLLNYRRCIFHGVAFLWRDKAYIFTGPSGTGKSTQYKRWREVFRDETSILNGDKPILEWCADDSFVVHPSPWRGKECYGSNRTAPLGGIIYLEQANRNQIKLITPDEAVIPIYNQFFFASDSKGAVRNACALVNALVTHVPLWKLENLADTEAVLIASRAIEEYEDDIQECSQRCCDKIQQVKKPDFIGNNGLYKGKESPPYKVHPGIVSAEICGRSFLMAVRTARQDCPRILEMNEYAAFCWPYLEKESDIEQLIRAIMVHYNVNREEAVSGLNVFMKQLEEHHYIVRN